MSRYRTISALFIITAYCVAICAVIGTLPTVYAQDTELSRVTVVVLDQSGSMRTGSDPRDKDGLRCSAVRLLTDLATTRDYLALVKLESHDLENDMLAEVLSPPLQMGQEQNQNQYKEKIDCDTATNNTPIADALKKAYEQLDAATQVVGGPFEGQVLLLTDGDPLPQPDKQIKQIDAQISSFVKRQWRVNTIGLKLQQNKQTQAKDLLEKMAYKTRGTFYGDVDEPLKLQNIFIKFFAQQTGRNLVEGSRQTLSRSGEISVNVPQGVSHIDILVAKQQPDAKITLLNQDNKALAPGDVGVVLHSDNDKFYAAYSIDHPAHGRWKIQSSKDTTVVVNTLLSYNLKLVFADANRPRAANQPITLIARFTDVQSGTPAPIILDNASVNARLEFVGTAYPVSMRDDGQPPDANKEDGLYTGTVSNSNLTFTGSDPVSGVVVVDADYEGRHYSTTATITILPVPNVALDDADGILTLPPDSPVDVALRLDWKGKQVSPDGWDIRTQQTINGQTSDAPIQRRGDLFITHLQSQAEGQEEYDLVAILTGTDQNAGVEEQLFQFKLRVVFRPTLDLAYQAPTSVPVGHVIVMQGALLSRFDQPQPRDHPLDMQVTKGDALPINIIGKPGAQPGIFDYTFEAKKPGVYRFTLFDRNQRTNEAEKDEITISVEPVPSVNWQVPAPKQEKLDQTLIRWPLLDTLRRIPIVGWPVSWFADDTHSQRLSLQGVVNKGVEPFSGRYTLRIVNPNANPSIVFEQEQFDALAQAQLDLVGGSYSVELIFKDLFDRSIDCCKITTPLVVQQLVSPLDTVLFGLILASEATALLLFAICVRFGLAPKPRKGDRIWIRLLSEREEKSIDLHRVWGVNLIHPSRRNLHTHMSRHGIKLGGKASIVTYTGRGVRIGTQAVSREPHLLKGAIPQVEARFEGGQKIHSARRRRRPVSRGNRRGGFFSSIMGLFGGAYSSRKNPLNNRSKKKRR